MLQTISVTTGPVRGGEADPRAISASDNRVACTDDETYPMVTYQFGQSQGLSGALNRYLGYLTVWNQYYLSNNSARLERIRRHHKVPLSVMLKNIEQRCFQF